MKFNPFTGTLDFTGGGSSGAITIKEYDNADSSDLSEKLWVKRSFSGGGITGEYQMLGLLMLGTGEGASSYEL